ncbi:hypothetical protein [Pedobacter sp. R20-19]|uniref:hypothetical protein n=1 Tax=Pedobacter sp. R20-19 TaxID=1270196 RepID=UPI0004939034|nr:hypothetical protein [Pedobacter sp. R20-19]
MQSKKVCLITPGHISSNPRLIKEATSLSNAGYQVHIVFTQYMEYLIAEDRKILDAHPNWTYDQLLWTPINKTLKLKTAIIQRFAKWINPIIKTTNLLINRNYVWQLKVAIKANADLYIAHNLGALPVAVNAAKKNQMKCGFDAEDFHRHEVTDNQNDADVRLKKSIEDEYLNKADYITTASPLISEAYKQLYQGLYPIVINNVFEIKYQPEFNNNINSKLRLFWFSQTIGKNRGLEDVIKALNQINNPLVELHLLGNLATEDANYFDKFANFEIKYYEPISADQIFKLAAKFDLGLALELNTPINRDICLTNKIFTYLIAGLAIIASNTKAQHQFLEENKHIGELYPIGNVNALAHVISRLFNDRALLNNYRKNAYFLAKSKYNWEMEQQKILTNINLVIN